MSPRWAALGLPLLLAIDAGGGEPPPPPDLDARYALIMKAAADLVSSLGQTPEDLAQVRRQEARLRQEVSLLAELATEPATGAPPTAGEEAGAGSIAAPSGPVPPSTAPTPEDERVRQERATMRGPLPTPMPGAPTAPPPARSLADVPEQEIRDACRAALEQLAAVASQLGSQEPDLRSMTDAAERVHAGLARLGAPAPRRRQVERPPTEPDRP